MSMRASLVVIFASCVGFSMGPGVIAPRAMLLAQSDVAPARLWAAEEINGQLAVEAGAQALRRAAGFPWYDADSDRLRPVPLPADQPPLQSSDWEWQPASPTSRRGPSQLLRYAVWAFLATTLFVLLYFLLRSVNRRYFAPGAGAASEAARRETEADRIENLPFPVKRPQTDLLGEARRHYALGNYGEAMIYLFSYQLVQLDQQDFIRLARGKTNRQYLGELRPTTPLGRILGQAIVAFEDVFFGHHPLTRERFEACWNRLNEFHRLIQLSSEGV